MWATHGRRVFFCAAGSRDWTQLATFPRSWPRDAAAPSRLARRVLRTDKCNVYPTRSGRLLGIRCGQVYRIEEGRMVPLFRMSGACVMSRSIAETPTGELYFGEYFGNAERGPVRLFRIDPALEHHEVAYTFAPGHIRHVHAVHADPWHEGRLWVATGDFEGESWLGWSDDGFRVAEFLGDGGQTWRMVGILFKEDRLCWLTDSHIAQNHIVSMDRASHRIQLHGERDASSWFAAETTDGRYLVTTTVEPGPGIQTDRCRVLVSEDGIHYDACAEFRKDPWSMSWFGFGSIALPSGRFSSRDFWISGEGLTGLEGTPLHASLSD